MESQQQSGRRFGSRRLIILSVVIIVALEATAGYFGATHERRKADAAADEAFSNMADETVASVGEQLGAFTSLVEGVSAHYVVEPSSPVGSLEQLTDSTEFFVDHPSATLLAWIRRVERDDLERHLTELGEQVGPGFSPLVDAERRDWFAVTSDVASPEMDGLPLGVDAALDPDLLEGFERSAQSGEMTVASISTSAGERSQRLRESDSFEAAEAELAEEELEAPLSYLLLVPVHSEPLPAQPVGWLTTQLSLPRFGDLAGDVPLRFDVQLVGAGADQLESRLGGGPDSDDRFTRTVALSHGGLEWEVSVSAEEEQVLPAGASDDELAVAMTIVGIILTLIGGFHLTHSAGTAADLSRALYDSRDRLRTDEQTGALNRLGITEVLRAHVLEGRRVAVAFFDLDDFKRVNDSLGHRSGDVLLSAVYQRLHGAVGEDADIGRFGGDEFVVVSREPVAEDEVVAFGARVLDVVSDPFRIPGGAIETTMSVGVTSANRRVIRTAEDLLRDADAAMYRAKRAGGNRVALFDSELRAGLLRRLELEQMLRAAPGDGSMHLAFQTLHRAVDRSVVGVEALLRWQPKGELVSPAEFIPVAEDGGMMPAIGTWVLEQALLVGAGLYEQQPDIVIAVNLSVGQLFDADLIEKVRAALDVSGLAPSQLCLEVNEEAVVDAGSDLTGVLERLSEMGVRLALDDFGSGRTSLTHLTALPMLDQVKLDRRFVRDLTDSPIEQAIVSSLLTIARATEMEVVVEGVETHEQADVLARLGVDVLQGFHLSRPVPASELVAGRMDRASAPSPA